MFRLASRLVAAAALAGAALVWPFGAPALAAGCTTGSGVTVVVDFNGLGGGGVQSACVSGGGGDDARELFAAAGFPLTEVVNTPGFVCRVSGVPASDNCQRTPPASAYWGLWRADGRGGDWAYASEGVESLTIPDGAYVAFAWDAVDGSPKPRLDPAAHQAAPSAPPTTSGGTGAGHGGSGGAGGGTSHGGSTTGGGQGGATTTTAPTSSASSAPSAAPSATTSAAPGTPAGKRKAKGKNTSAPTTSPSATPSATESAPVDGDLDDAAPSAAEPEDDGLPAFVAPVLIGTLFGAAGVAVLLRRRSGPA